MVKAAQAVDSLRIQARGFDTFKERIGLGNEVSRAQWTRRFRALGSGDAELLRKLLKRVR